MKEIDSVRYDDRRLVLHYYDNYYDHPLSGLAYFDGRDELVWFEWPYQEEYIYIFELTNRERMRKWWSMKLFQWCVGYHTTIGSNGLQMDRFKWRKPEWFFKLLFKGYYGYRKLKRRMRR